MQGSMRAVLVDDEPVARRVLREELEELEIVKVVGEAENGKIALEVIAALHPDVVFLDLQMPVMNGFETVAQLQGAALPAIVILTAFDEFAVQAFEAGAIDYLLKPVGQNRLKRTIERLQQHVGDRKRTAEMIAQIQETPPFQEKSKVQKIVGKRGEEYFLLNVEEVLAFQADGHLTWILTSNHRYLATQNLKTLEGRLQGPAFRRIHRNALININQIRKMSMITSQRWLVTMSNGQQFTVSKRQAKNIREVLHW
jgi:DNA-binding LytR/AlgR family response regulator